MEIRGSTRSAWRAILICAALLLCKAPALAGSTAITFLDLPDPAAQSFEDPFKDMGFKMLEELRTVVRLEQRLANGEVSAEALPRLQARVDAARKVLEANGYDIADLLSQRWTVAENRRRAKTATNPGLSGKDVSISGFLIPAGKDANGERVGYLVAEIGMCSHIPPPPPNQLVRVSLPRGLPTTSLYEPVRITGTLEPTPHDTTIFLLDGEVRMVGTWAMKTSEIQSPGANDTARAQGRSFRAYAGAKALRSEAKQALADEK